MSAREDSEKHVPTIDELIETGFQGVGGVCNELNYFAKLILLSIGFDAYTIRGRFYGTLIFEGNHVMTVVRLSPNESYLIDLAAVNPIQEPIPLHQLPHMRKSGEFFYEYRHVSDGNYARYQVGGSFFNGPFTEDKREETRLDFTLNEVKYEDFHETMIKVYTRMDISIMLTMPMCFRYTEFTKEKCKFVLFWANRMLEATMDERKITKFSTLNEMIPIFRKYFPEVKNAEIEAAWKVFNEAQTNKVI